MSDCCPDYNKKCEEEKEKVRIKKMPTSFIGKYLYKLGGGKAAKGDYKKGDCC